LLSLLGVGLPVVMTAPASAAGLLGGIRSISAGADETCAVLQDTTARCWGYNAVGQVGDGTTTDRLRPVVVKNVPGTGPLKNVAQIAIGNSHACALIRDGSARCWGQGGELGDGTDTSRSRPVLVRNVAGNGALTNITQISAGGGQTCVRMTDGTARCWGVDGALGNGTRSSRLPVRVLNAAGTGPQTHITQISVGRLHTCVRMTDNTARCWGFNDSGELGDGTTTDHLRQVKVLNVAGTGPQTNITQIVAGYYHTCARITDGTARCWGFNADGELGDGTKIDHSRPVRVLNGRGTGPLQRVTEITVGAHHSCARIADGTARCWGRRLALADANNSPTPGYRLLPAPVMDYTGTRSMPSVAKIVAGTGHTCVRKSDGTARCFGENGEGELGNGTRTTHHFPVGVG
jgi:alpha-tubulin suppressor-like RCC1 family protein